ncbi:MAG: GntR family transcriptional regulator [Ktedonobacterales bacterium]
MLLHIEVTSEKPLYQQIYDQVVQGIATGQLQPGKTLPSLRQLAADFGINLHTVSKAYELLEQDGFLRLKPKTGALIHIAPMRTEWLESWEERQRTLLAEASARRLAPAEILEHCQRILATFRPPDEASGSAWLKEGQA